jgi:hypothetical protein
MGRRYLSRMLRDVVPQRVIDSTRPMRNNLEIQIKERIGKNPALCKTATRLFGPLYGTNPEIIELNITFDCNLKCFNCNRSCRQAPDKASMTVEQFKKFLDESARSRRAWRTISILGGEPTLHPDILEMVELLIAYANQGRKKTRLQLVTNGFGPEVNDVLPKIPREVFVENTVKKSVRNRFYSFNLAPVDLEAYGPADYSNKCVITQACGMALSKHGYYICSNAAGIDRVFGFDIGRKTLPAMGDEMLEQATLLCRYCGRFKVSHSSGCVVDKEEISSSWANVYKKFKEQKPVLTEY